MKMFLLGLATIVTFPIWAPIWIIVVLIALIVQGIIVIGEDVYDMFNPPSGDGGW